MSGRSAAIRHTKTEAMRCIRSLRAGLRRLRKAAPGEYTEAIGRMEILLKRCERREAGVPVGYLQYAGEVDA